MHTVRDIACSTFDDPADLAALSELGVLFLLFEMGLELSSDRLRALKSYAFGLGTVQVVVTTFTFVCFAVPFGRSLGTGAYADPAYQLRCDRLSSACTA